MRIVVCMKRVPDTESVIRIAPGGGAVDTADLSYIINPYDEYAIEAALQMKDTDESVQVLLLTLGESSAESTIRKGLAMGADEAVLLQVPADVSDPLRTAQLLAEWLKANPADLVLAGKQGVDFDHGAVPGMVAELLGWASATSVCAFSCAGGQATVEREVEGGRERVRLPLPCVVSADKGLNEPRYASLKGIMGAKKKPLTVVECPVEPSLLGSLEAPPARPAGRVVGQGAAAATELARLLKDEARVL